MRFADDVTAESFHLGGLPCAHVSLHRTAGIISPDMVELVDDIIDMSLSDPHTLRLSHLAGLVEQSLEFGCLIFVLPELTDGIVIICCRNIVSAVQYVFAPDLDFYIICHGMVYACTGQDLIDTRNSLFFYVGGVVYPDLHHSEISLLSHRIVTVRKGNYVYQ